jgi:hypothetical protein
LGDRPSSWLHSGTRTARSEGRTRGSRPSGVLLTMKSLHFAGFRCRLPAPCNSAGRPAGVGRLIPQRRRVRAPAARSGRVASAQRATCTWCQSSREVRAMFATASRGAHPRLVVASCAAAGRVDRLGRTSDSSAQWPNRRGLLGRASGDHHRGDRGGRGGHTHISSATTWPRWRSSGWNASPCSPGTWPSSRTMSPHGGAPARDREWPGGLL